MDDKKEIQEAISIGESVLLHLNRSLEILKSASSWGVFDLIGGGIISTAIKHNKMDNAEEELNQAKEALVLYKDNLSDISDIESINVQVDSFLSVADYFFDGLVSDWIVHSKINDTINKVSDAISKVQQVQSSLKSML